jgi:putative membrane protein
MSEQFWQQSLPAINAGLNAISATLLLLGWLAIRSGRWRAHAAFMLAALCSSSLFLCGYLLRMAHTGAHRFAGPAWLKVPYLVILFSHMVLAVALLPLIGAALWQVYRQRFERHRRVARVAWPVWMYVSVTGVVVYAMLYRL